MQLDPVIVEAGQASIASYLHLQLVETSTVPCLFGPELAAKLVAAS